MITRSDAFPCAAARNASTARASAYGLEPLMSVVLRPATVATSPTRITWAPPAALDPVGCSALSADSDAAGSEVPSLSRIGAPTGLANSAEAAIPARQSPLSTKVTAAGCEPGNTACDTAAALATGSAPPTRVVFFVATEGKPRPCAACVSVPFAPRFGCVLLLADLPPQPTSARQAVITIARRMRRRTIAPPPGWTARLAGYHPRLNADVLFRIDRPVSRPGAQQRGIPTHR